MLVGGIAGTGAVFLLVPSQISGLLSTVAASCCNLRLRFEDIQEELHRLSFCSFRSPFPRMYFLSRLLPDLFSACGLSCCSEARMPVGQIRLEPRRCDPCVVRQQCMLVLDSLHVISQSGLVSLLNCYYGGNAHLLRSVLWERQRLNLLLCALWRHGQTLMPDNRYGQLYAQWDGDFQHRV